VIASPGYAHRSSSCGDGGRCDLAYRTRWCVPRQPSPCSRDYKHTTAQSVIGPGHCRPIWVIPVATRYHAHHQRTGEQAMRVTSVRTFTHDDAICPPQQYKRSAVAERARDAWRQCTKTSCIEQVLNPTQKCSSFVRGTRVLTTFYADGKRVWRPSIHPSVFLSVPFFLTLIGRAAHTQRDSPGGSTLCGQRTSQSEY